MKMFLHKLWFAVSIVVCYSCFRCAGSTRNGIDNSKSDYTAEHHEDVGERKEWKVGDIMDYHRSLTRRQAGSSDKGKQTLTI